MRYFKGQFKRASKFEGIVFEGYGNRYKSYIEPFVGGCGMMQRVPKIYGCTAKGYDKNVFLISMLKYFQFMQNTSFNYDVSQELLDMYSSIETKLFDTRIDFKEYSDLKKTFQLLIKGNYKIHEKIAPYVGFVGFTHSTMGDFFNSYATKEEFDRTLSSIKHTVDNLNGVILEERDILYDPILDISDSIIYVNPPQYGDNAKWNGMSFVRKWLRMDGYTKLYDIMRTWRNNGNKVFLFSDKAPIDFTPIWCDGEFNVEFDDFSCYSTNNKEILFVL